MTTSKRQKVEVLKRGGPRGHFYGSTLWRGNASTL